MLDVERLLVLVYGDIVRDAAEPGIEEARGEPGEKQRDEDRRHLQQIGRGHDPGLQEIPERKERREQTIGIDQGFHGLPLGRVPRGGCVRLLIAILARISPIAAYFLLGDAKMP